MWRLLQAPERWEQLKANPSLIESAVEESLRYDPPVLAHFRTSLCPVTMHGEQLPERTKLMFNITGANRDPQRFADPEHCCPTVLHPQPELACVRLGRWGSSGQDQ